LEVPSCVPGILHCLGHVGGPSSCNELFGANQLKRVALVFLPDSPRWLLMLGRDEEARSLLAQLADATVNSEEVEVDLKTPKMYSTHKVETDPSRCANYFITGHLKTCAVRYLVLLRSFSNRSAASN
jgi:hypothetical protein